MYKIKSVKIDGFWCRFDVYCEFHDDVNIIIGQNGTGKTTFMNILHSVLSVDLDGIDSNDFNSVIITLTDGDNEKIIKATKNNDGSIPFSLVEYELGHETFEIKVFPIEERRFQGNYKRRAIEESEDVRNELAKLVSLSTLSVYRLRSGDDFEIRDRHGLRIINPVDYRLSQILQQLTKYQLDLSQRARDVAVDLQKEVLASILYSESDSRPSGFELQFNKEREKESLISAYRQLNVIDSKIIRKINYHVNTIDKTVRELRRESNEDIAVKIDFRSLEAFRQTQKIIKMSLSAEEDTKEIYYPIQLFLDTISNFILNKSFDFIAGELVISNKFGVIDHNALSSGEKQLLILLIETLLQKSEPYIFITDEPELSLHVAWQRQIIPAIRKLNINAQVIAATHSPEVASKYKSYIYDMEGLVHDNF